MFGYFCNNFQILSTQHLTVDIPYFQIDDFSLVKFLPLDITDEDSINDVLIQIDASIQYGEDLEHKEEKVIWIPFSCFIRFIISKKWSLVNVSQYPVYYNDIAVSPNVSYLIFYSTSLLIIDYLLYIYRNLILMTRNKTFWRNLIVNIRAMVE